PTRGPKIAGRGHRDGVTQLAFSADGRRIVSLASGDGAVVVWNAATGKLLRQIAGGGAVDKFAVARDGPTLALPGREGEESCINLALWDLHTGRPRPVQFIAPGTLSINNVAFLPGGATLVTTGVPEGKVYLWDVKTGRPQRILTTALQVVEQVAVAPDG